MNGSRQHLLSAVLRGGVAIIALGMSGVAFAGSAAADATDDYPIPHRMIITTCTAEQILAAARDFAPIYYQRYMIDKHKKPPEVQQAAIDSAHYFYSLSPADRRAYSEQMPTHFAVPRRWRGPTGRRSSSTTKASRRRKPTTAPTTRRTTHPCGTGESR